MAWMSPAARGTCLQSRQALSRVGSSSQSRARRGLASILLLTDAGRRADTQKRGGTKVLKKTWYALIAIAIIAGVPIVATAQTQGTIKIGVLHSLSGTMAISETTLKDTI